MPEDFDAAPGAADDREFKLGGQVYRIRRKVRPEVLGMLESISSDRGDETIDQTVARLDALIREVLVKRDVERWTAARAVEDDEGENTISLDDLNRVIGWAIERLVNRPLDKPDSSGGQPEPSEPTSPAHSSSLVALPSTG